jgi:rod shape-determining protein MreC
MDIPSRHRPLVLLAGVMLAQVLLLAFQIKRDRDVRLIRLWSVELLTPLQRAGTWLIGELHGGWRGYVDLRHARQENEELRTELGRLQLRNRELESRAAEADRLAAVLGFRQAHAEVPMLAAEVIGASADAASKTVYINRGSHDGVRRNMGVITPDGVVGKIIEVFPNTSMVLLLTDHDSGVGALLATSRTHGVVKGEGEPFARMEYVINDEKVPDGEEILTSGEDRIFPKDLPVGTVAGTQDGNPFKIIRVRPAARLDRLEEVIVLLTQRELNPQNEAEPAAPAAKSGETATSPSAPTKQPEQKPAQQPQKPGASPAPAKGAAKPPVTAPAKPPQ